MNSQIKRGWKFIFFPLIALAFVLVAGYAVMFLWNAILPVVIVSVGTLTYPQAIGLLILSRILFGGFRGRGGYGRKGMNYSSPWKEKMMNMSEEERAKFKNEWQERCGRKSG